MYTRLWLLWLCCSHLHSSGATWRTGSPKAKYTFNSPGICLLIGSGQKRLIFWVLQPDLLDTTRLRISMWGPQLLVTSVFKCPCWIKCLQIYGSAGGKCICINKINTCINTIQNENGLAADNWWGVMQRFKAMECTGICLFSWGTCML